MLAFRQVTQPSGVLSCAAMVLASKTRGSIEDIECGVAMEKPDRFPIWMFEWMGTTIVLPMYVFAELTLTTELTLTRRGKDISAAWLFGSEGATGLFFC